MKACSKSIVFVVNVAVMLFAIPLWAVDVSELDPQFRPAAGRFADHDALVVVRAVSEQG